MTRTNNQKPKNKTKNQKPTKNQPIHYYQMQNHQDLSIDSSCHLCSSPFDKEEHVFFARCMLGASFCRTCALEWHRSRLELFTNNVIAIEVADHVLLTSRKHVLLCICSKETYVDPYCTQTCHISRRAKMEHKNCPSCNNVMARMPIRGVSQHVCCNHCHIIWCWYCLSNSARCHDTCPSKLAARTAAARTAVAATYEEDVAMPEFAMHINMTFTEIVATIAIFLILAAACFFCSLITVLSVTTVYRFKI